MNQYLTGLTACRRLAATGVRSHAAGICVALSSGVFVCVCVWGGGLCMFVSHAHYVLFTQREKERERDAQVSTLNPKLNPKLNPAINTGWLSAASCALKPEINPKLNPAINNGCLSAASRTLN